MSLSALTLDVGLAFGWDLRVGVGLDLPPDAASEEDWALVGKRPTKGTPFPVNARYPTSASLKLRV